MSLEESRTGPGTLTSLIEQVVKGAAPAAREGAWTDGMRSGTVIGRYELLREVGRGGFGVVWEARDRDLGRTVAFKALRARGELGREKRLLAEAEVAARLSHPNIVTVLDVGRSDQGVYLVQEFLSGQTLARRLETGALPLREALQIGVALARGLAHAHAHGVVHRDLKPENVQLCEDGQVKLLDLGMAAALGRRKLDGGTPAFMAPEQADGAPEDERTDVYALGVLLYRMLTGVAPVEVDPLGRPRSISRGLAVELAPTLGHLVESMLAKAPTDRPRDAGEVLAALAEIEAALPREAGSTGPAARVRRGPRVRWLVAGVVAALLVVVPVGAVFAVWKGRSQPLPSSALVMATTSAYTPCRWHSVAGLDLDQLPPGAVLRNGQFQGQGPSRADGRPSWLQRSDWNQLIVPIGDLLEDVFAVQAEFLISPAEAWGRSVHMVVFTDPEGPDASDVRHGLGIALNQEPGGQARFTWGLVQGRTWSRVTYSGDLPRGFTGAWRTLRIEGSKSGCWLRASLDGVPLLVALGDCDLTGGHVLLSSNGAAYRPADAHWRELTFFRGGPECR